MIKAEELRRGNFVNRQYWNPHPENPGFLYDACQVDVIKSDNVNIRLSDNSIIAKVDIKRISPIQLTPAILEKCGFADDTYANFSKQIGDFSYLVVSFKDDACTQIREHISIADHDISLKCEYLHQLQNLYYALTQTELTINL